MSNVIINPYVFAGEYTAFAVDNQATGFLARGGTLTGAADGQKGILSVWINIQAGDGVEKWWGYNQGFAFSLRQNASNKISVQARNSSATVVLDLTSTSSYIVADGWTHILASWDLSVPVAHLYRDDSDDEASSTETDDTIDYLSGTDFEIWAAGNSTNLPDCLISELYINQAEYLNLDAESNRRKFRSAEGKPVDLGATGERPTGSQPIVCLNDSSSVANWYANSGSGGAFSVSTGAFIEAASSPSD